MKFPRVNVSEDYLNIVFQDNRSGSDQIYYVYAVNGDRLLSNSEASARKPAVCADPGNKNLLFVAWNDTRGASEEVYLRQVNADIGEEVLISEPGNSSTEVDLKVRHGVCYLAWQDSRDGNTEIYMRQWR